ncbi:hypothetical protein AK830_g6864 [Neonectria ditissima]|uniref:N-acetyltransferase domain-containing protein n=1 Tax=Neonectria ditissima TaxID=78410 RepID=A0A0P7B0Y6_9HYPO|nr:hypothetical protein AK830_g6864 [Neonectria ditissima]
MTLPTAKPAQLSIRSFFQPKGPKYAPPPSKVANFSAPTPPAPPAPAASRPEEDAAADKDDQDEEDQDRDQEDDQDVESPAPSPNAIPPLPASLPREASIRPVTRGDINALRRINALLLPVSYSDHFYQRAVDPAASAPFSRVITWAHDGAEPKVVGGVVCQVERTAYSSDGDLSQHLYIQSLCLLSPYRSLGLVNAAVDNIVATAVADPRLDVSTVTAHVWTENEEGLKWYEGRGFQRDESPIHGYYMKLRPNSAWLVRRPVRANVRNSLPSTSSAPNRSTVSLSATAAVANLLPMVGPPKGPTRPQLSPSGQSYQNQRADTEWNDLPEDMATGRLVVPGAPMGSSETKSAGSSRSSSTARKKRDRSYPAAAFGK